MKKHYRRTPKYYDGTEVTSHHMNELLPKVLANIGQVYQNRADLILAAWPEVIGPQLAGMTQAISFIEGVLVVKVKNSTLHSLLNQNEKQRMVAVLRKKFPDTEIKTIAFRIG